MSSTRQPALREGLLFNDNRYLGSEVLVSYASLIKINAAEAFVHHVVLSGNPTFLEPANPKAGRKMVIRLEQDAAGSHTVTWSSAFRFSTDLPSPTLSTAAGATDQLGFIYNGQSLTWDLVGQVLGF
jgi:hypothetical protein